jgi:hypothetical protein
LGRDLYVAHDVELVDFVEANLLADRLLLFDLEDVARFTDAETLGVDVGSTEFITRSDETADIRARRFLGKAGEIKEGELAVGVGDGFGLEERVCFLWETDGSERTAWAFG